MVTDKTCGLGQAYDTLTSLFVQTKKMYTQYIKKTQNLENGEEKNILSPDHLHLTKPQDREIIRHTNLATFISSVFGGGGVGFYELNEQFINCFTREGCPLDADASRLFLNLKTQVYLSAISQEEQIATREDLLEDFFPDELEAVLKKRHPGKPLPESEVEFVKQVRARRQFLNDEPSDVHSLRKF